MHSDALNVRKMVGPDPVIRVASMEVRQYSVTRQRDLVREAALIARLKSQIQGLLIE